MLDLLKDSERRVLMLRETEGDGSGEGEEEVRDRSFSEMIISSSAVEDRDGQTRSFQEKVEEEELRFGFRNSNNSAGSDSERRRSLLSSVTAPVNGRSHREGAFSSSSSLISCNTVTRYSGSGIF